VSEQERHSHGHQVFKRPAHVDVIVGPGEPDNPQLGSLLRTLRNQARLSRADAAAKLGLSAEYLRLIEAGKRTPALGQMPRLLEAYGAQGGIEQPQPDGSVADLIVINPGTGDPWIVEFRSRIREARRSGIQDPGADLDWDDADEDEPFGEGLPEPRAAELGMVVSLLSRADADTLRRIRKMLEREVR
jgi:transcriptional regulator with XRE-family HTH domain